MRLFGYLASSSNRVYRSRPTIDSTEDFRKYGKKMVDMIADYHDNIENLHVVPDVKPGYIADILPDEAPQFPESWESIEKDFQNAILPGVTHWNSPNFYAYYPTGNSYPAILGGMLADAIGCVGFSWIASPACTELEMLTMDWLAKMCEFPDYFLHSHPGTGGGVIQGSSSESTLVAMLAAKLKRLQQLDDPGLAPKLVAYTSNEAHSSVEKAFRLVNANIRFLETDSKYSLRGDALFNAIQEDKRNGLIPFAVAGSFGTTSVCSFDNVKEIGEITNEENIWLHVDAAYAGSALICPEFRHLMQGVDKVDSIAMSCHKWFKVNFSCAAMYFKNSLDVINSFQNDPLYLKHDYQQCIPDYRHWQLPLGRKFRSLKLWMVLKSYGVTGLQDNIRKQVKQAKDFEKLIKTDDRFELFHDRELSLVTFRIKASDELNAELNRRINEEKKIHMTPSSVEGKFVQRFVIASRLTEDEDIEYAWDVIRKHVDYIENDHFKSMSMDN